MREFPPGWAAVHYEPGAVWELRVSSDEKTCVLWCRYIEGNAEDEREFVWCKCEGEPKGHPQVSFSDPTARRIVVALTEKIHAVQFDERAN